ncbi:hypothetical protein ACIBQ1_19480 [Nonomuraea sp. NPDC050153]|uniref:hypothetical protein n=1 Tax=Nonomuraea sp. NPDC050153 TaxID=3364359 RepID=UPI0037B5D5EE
MKRYGAPLWHLLALVACFVVAGYVATRVVAAGIWLGFAVWFAGAIILHDLVLLPLYSAADVATQALTRRLARPRRAGAVNHLRVPAMLSGLLLLVWFPLILRGAERNYRWAVGLSISPYLARWSLITLVLFGVSGLLYAMRRRAPGRGRGRRNP